MTNGLPRIIANPNAGIVVESLARRKAAGNATPNILQSPKWSGHGSKAAQRLQSRNLRPTEHLSP